MIFTLNNPRGGGDMHLNLQEAHFPPTRKAASCIIHGDSQETEVPSRHTSYSHDRLVTLISVNTASRREQGGERGTEAVTLETLDFPLLRDRGSCQKICSHRFIPLGEETVNDEPHMRRGSFQWEPFLPRWAPGCLAICVGSERRKYLSTNPLSSRQLLQQHFTVYWSSKHVIKKRCFPSAKNKASPKYMCASFISSLLSTLRYDGASHRSESIGTAFWGGRKVLCRGNPRNKQWFSSWGRFSSEVNFIPPLKLNAGLTELIVSGSKGKVSKTIRVNAHWWDG